MSDSQNTSLIRALRQVFQTELFLYVDPQPITPPTGLAVGVRNRFAFYESDLHGEAFIFVVPKEAVDEAPTRFLKMWEQVHESVDPQIPVYVTDSISLASRRILVAKGVSFVVPGKQIYLAPIHVHFQEDNLWDPIRARPSEVLPPTSRHILATLLQCEGLSRIQSEYDAIFGVSRMTVSRIVRDFEARGWIRLQAAGRSNEIALSRDPQEIWQEAKLSFPSPVVETYQLEEKLSILQIYGMPGGYTFLGDHTTLADNPWPTVAIERKVFHKYQDQIQKLQIVSDRPKMQVEVWAYPPRLPEAAIPNPEHRLRKPKPDILSVLRSFDDPVDERTAEALETLQGKVTWSQA